MTDYLIPDIVKICCEYSSMELCKDCIETKHLDQCWYPKLLKKHPCDTDLKYSFSSTYFSILQNGNRDILKFEHKSDQEVWDWIYNIHLKSFKMDSTSFETKYGTHKVSRLRICVDGRNFALFDWYNHVFVLVFDCEMT